MSLLAEELVEEWLNRRGYFTIRGVKAGVHEIDVLAVRPSADGGLDCRHVEVQASVRPVGYLTQLAAADQQADDVKATSAKRRTPEQMRAAVQAWVEKKYHLPVKERVRRALVPGPWHYELVAHNVRDERELQLIRDEGVHVHRLSAVVRELLHGGGRVIASAAGTVLTELVALDLRAAGADVPGADP